MSSLLNGRQIISFQNAVILAICILLGYVGMVILLRNDPLLLIAINDLASVIINGIAAASLLYASRRSQRYGYRAQLAWTILALAQISFVIGDLAWMIVEVWLQRPTLASISDGPYLMFYPLFLAGVLLLPAECLSSRERLKSLIDMGVVMIGSTLIFWTLLIAPTIATAYDTDLLTEALSIAYPVMDLVLLFALIELIFRRLKSARQGPLLLLAASAVAMISTDFIWLSQSLNGTYESGGLLDAGWIVTYLLTALAGVLQSEVLPESSSWKCLDTSYVQFSWPSYLPYICVGASFMLLAWSHDHEMPVSFSTMSWSVGSIIGLLILRQVTALDENSRLYKSTLNEVAVRKEAEEAVKRLNEELEARVKSRTRDLKAANEGLQREILERRRVEEELFRRDKLLSGVAMASNLLLTISDYEAGLKQALGLMGTALDVDRSDIFGDSGHRFEWIREDFCFAEGVQAVQEGQSSASTTHDLSMPRWRAILASGKAIKGLVKDLPASEREVLEPQGIISFMAVPILVKGKLWGGVRFADCHSEHEWADCEESILFTFAGSIEGLVVRQEAEDVLKASIREKEVLLKEVHHRVKNNMQVISSLLSIQSRYVIDKAASESFMESRSRIRSMALVHETLYRSNDLARIDFAEYLKNLVRHLRSFYISSKNIKFSINSDPIFLDIEKAVPCGLIINELVTNSIRHAFPDSRNGEIYIGFSSADGMKIELAIRDDGVGLPSDLDLKCAKTMGLKLVAALANQLTGTIEVRRDEGTEFIIIFSLKDPASLGRTDDRALLRE